MSDNTQPPSPLPPWCRAPLSPNTQMLTGAGAITLTEDTTYLNATLGGPFAITLPDGSYKRQYKSIYVLGTNALTTATFNLTGTLVGASSLTFNRLAFNAVLQWDGTAWHMIGGNAVVNP